MSKDQNIPWNSLPEGKITCHKNMTWVVRTGVVVNKPKKQKKYEDNYLTLSSLEGEGNSILGYLLQVKKDFDKTFVQDSYVSFLANVTEHTEPKVLFKDPKVYLYRFNEAKNPSYWFLFRSRTT